MIFDKRACFSKKWAMHNLLRSVIVFLLRLFDYTQHCRVIREAWFVPRTCHFLNLIYFLELLYQNWKKRKEIRENIFYYR